MKSKYQISASVMCADLCNLSKSVREIADAEVDLLHIDIIDGRFSPSMPLGLDQVRQLRKVTDMAFDAHVMALENDFIVDELLDIGVERLCFHVETTLHISKLIDRIRRRGVEVGLALLPTTPFSSIEYCVQDLDFVLLMLINPGFSHQSGEVQVPYAVRRVASCQEYLSKLGSTLPIQVDGRVGFEKIKPLHDVGATIFVGGSTSVFTPGTSIAQNVNHIRKILDC